MNKKEWLSKALETIDTMSREDFIQSLENAGFFKESTYVNPADIPHALPDYGDLITRAEWEDHGWYYDTCFASDGKVYWHQDPEFTECTHVLCLSK